ncbi:MAG: hypothetical protein ACREQY_12205, partial [Candidatus Binatia bacterium]
IGTLGRNGMEGGAGEDADVFASFTSSTKGAVAATDHRHVIFDRTTCPAVEIAAGGKVEVHGQLQVNAACSFPKSAIRMGDGASLQVKNGILTVGAVTLPAEAASPPPRPGSPAVADPLAGTAAPVFDGVTFTIPESRTPLEGRHGRADSPSTLLVDEPRTLSPGVYWGGLRVTSGGAATLEPGVYVIAGGGFMVHGTGQVTGREVVLYNTLDPVGAAGVGGYDQIVFGDSTVVALSAPGSGPYRGIVLFQDRANGRPVEIAGTLGGFDGVIYAPSAELQVGGAVSGLRADFLVGRLTTQGSFTLLPPTQILSSG